MCSAIGFAAFRDVASFFKYAAQDDVGTPNPVANGISGSSRGAFAVGQVPQGSSHLGFTQDEPTARYTTAHGRSSRPAHRAELPLRHARRRAEALRGRQRRPAVVGPVARSRPRTADAGHPRSLHRQQHVPEDHRALRRGGDLGPEADSRMGGHIGRHRHSAAENVRRYYIPSTPARRRRGGFNVNPPASPNCPGTNYGQGTFAANPVPHTETVNAIRHPLPQLGDERDAAAAEPLSDAGAKDIGP